VDRRLASIGDDNVDWEPGQFCGQLAQPPVAVGEAKLQTDVLAVDIAEFA